MVYKIADLTGKEQLVLDEILRWFQDDIIDVREEGNLPFSTVKKTCTAVPCQYFYRHKYWQGSAWR